jgi:hypothetical protein
LPVRSNSSVSMAMRVLPLIARLIRALTRKLTLL